jgi:hypothetical protein
VRNANEVQVAAGLETAVEVQKTEEFTKGAEFTVFAELTEFTKVAVKRRASIARMRETMVCQVHEPRQPCVPSEPVLRDDKMGQRQENVHKHAKL